jgi:hypothetical protein
MPVAAPVLAGERAVLAATHGRPVAAPQELAMVQPAEAD